VESSLEALQPVRSVRIDSADSPLSQIWNELLNQYHYLGAGPLCGAQIRYLIRGGAGEWLGGLAFSASAWRVEVRDRWIGWNEEAPRTSAGSDCQQPVFDSALRARAKSSFACLGFSVAAGGKRLVRAVMAMSPRWWKRLSMRSALQGPAIRPPTGSWSA
jgi:hypothetical protein